MSQMNAQYITTHTHTHKNVQNLTSLITLMSNSKYLNKLNIPKISVNPNMIRVKKGNYEPYNTLKHCGSNQTCQFAHELTI